MNESCGAVRSALEKRDLEGRPELGAHLSACPQCAAHARILAVLASCEPVEASEATVRAVMAALPPAPWQRMRLTAWLPLACSLALVVLGLVMLGGVPAGSVVAGVPSVAANLGGWIGGWVLDLLTVAESGGTALRALVTAAGAWFLAWLIMIGVGSGWAAVTLARRRRTEQ